MEIFGFTLKKMHKIIAASVVVFLLLIFFVFQIIDWNKADERLVHQSIIDGELTVIDQPGPYTKAFGDVTQYKKVVAVNFSGDPGAIASKVISNVPVRFLDTTTGQAKGVARFRLPGGKDLIKIHTEFGSQDTLISNLLVRSVTENVKASARMMSVEQHYSGGNGQLSQDFFDQLTNGIFVTEQIIEEPKTKAEEGALAIEENLSQQQRVTVKIKKDKDGNKLRNSPMLSGYGIAVVDASIIDVDYEEKVDERLERQKKAAADEALARQDLKKAEQQAKTAVAQGEKAIAEQRAESEKLKVKEKIDAERREQNAVIAARQQTRVARENAEKQKFILQKERLEAQGMDVLSSARKRAKESALDPKYVFDKKLEAEVEIKKSLYQNLGNAQLVPNITFNGGDSKGSSANGMDFLKVLAADSALDLSDRLKTTKQ